MLDWNPALYARFEDERTRPARDLLARVALEPAAVKHAVDLGCGPGNSTELLVARFPQVQVTGTDNSEAMLVSARERLSQVAHLVGRAGKTVDAHHTDIAVIIADEVEWITSTHRADVSHRHIH